jgi:hypothetical protein
MELTPDRAAGELAKLGTDGYRPLRTTTAAQTL